MVKNSVARRLFVFVTAAGVLLFLSSCATTKQIKQKAKENIIDMASYTVCVPAGRGWKTEIDEDREMATFTKLKVSWLTGIVTRATLIKVFPSEIKVGGWHLSEQEVADDFTDREESDMIARGVRTGEYDLTDVEKGTTTIGDKNLYFMSYKTWHSRGPSQPKVAGEAVLYLFFPADFRERHTFYVFLIDETCVHRAGRKADLTRINPVINSLQIK